MQTSGLAVEDHFQRELSVEGFASADSGSSVEIANCVKQLEGSVRSEVGVEVTLQWRSEVGPVQQVEHFNAELGANPLGDFCVLEHRKVNIGVARSVVGIAARCAGERTGRSIDEGAGVEPICKDLLLLCAGVGIGDLNGALHEFIRAAVIGRAKDAERQTAMEGEQTVQLPSVGEDLQGGCSRDPVGKQSYKDVPLVKVAVAIVSLEVCAVLGQGAAIGGDIVEGVGPGIGGLRG